MEQRAAARVALKLSPTVLNVITMALDEARRRKHELAALRASTASWFYNNSEPNGHNK
jgi:hypothetical protein